LFMKVYKLDEKRAYLLSGAYKKTLMCGGVGSSYDYDPIIYVCGEGSESRYDSNYDPIVAVQNYQQEYGPRYYQPNTENFYAALDYLDKSNSVTLPNEILVPVDPECYDFVKSDGNIYSGHPYEVSTEDNSIQLSFVQVQED